MVLGWPDEVESSVPCLPAARCRMASKGGFKLPFSLSRSLLASLLQ